MIRRHNKRQLGYKDFNPCNLIGYGLFRLNPVSVLLVLLTILPIASRASAPSIPNTQFQVSVGDWYCGSFTTAHSTFGSALAALYAYTNGCSVAGPVTVDTCSGIEPSTSTSGSCSFVRYKPSQGDSEGGSVSWSFSCSQAGTSYNPASGYCEAPDSWQAGKNDRASCNDVGNPCNAGTGHKHQIELEYQADGPGGLHFLRRYSSLQVGFSPLGNGWRHNYAGRVLKDPAGRFVRIERPNGQTLIFRPNGIGGWSTDSDINDQLQESAEWHYTTTDGEVEIYDHSGRLRSISDRNGITQTLIYSDINTAKTLAPQPGLLIEVIDHFGRRLRFDYDIKARIIMLTDPNGTETRYSYDTAGRLASVSYPDDTPNDTSDNPQRKYHYEDSHFPNALTSIDDEKGTRFASWRYDTQGRVISSSHAGDVEKVTLDYNDTGSTLISNYQSHPNTASISRIYDFQSILGVVKNTGISQPNFEGGTSNSAFTYDANGNIASRTDFNGNLSCYAYDLNRNLETVRLEGLAAGASCPADLAVYTPAANGIERKISTQWHASYRLPVQIDEAGRSISFSYDANGNLLNKTVTDTATQQSRSWSYTYNSNGQVLTEDGPRTDVNDITSYSYYADSTADHKPGDLWKVTNALGHVTTFTAYDGNGRLLSLTDPNGLVIGFGYDARGRLTQKTVDGNTTRYDYDPAGNLVKVTRPTGVYIRYTYDAAHRLTDITDALGGKIHYTLDLLGNRTKEEILDAAGTVVKTQSRQFDALSRLQQDIDAYNQATSYQYDANGNLTKVTDANGHATQHAYDSLNRLIRTTDALNGLTDYQYDAQDRLTQVTDAANHSTIYSYNGLGDLTQLDSPNTGISQYAYDSAGNLAQITDAGGVTATYQYDALNRLLGIDYPGTEADVANGYDSTALGLNGQVGRLTSARRGDIETRQQFDARGNLTANAVTDLTDNRIVSDLYYAYNADDQVTVMRPMLNRSIENVYDATGQVRRVQVVDTDANSSTTSILADSIQHLPFGPVTGLNYGNGLVLRSDYSKDYLVDSNIVLGGDIKPQYYIRNRLGSVEFITDLNENLNIDSSKYLLEYDTLNRLSMSYDGPLFDHSVSYLYDVVGNRTAQYDSARGNTSYHYDLSNQQLLKTVHDQIVTNYVNNPQGNIQQIGNRSLYYAADQRLSRVEQNNVTLGSYRYDAFGHRIGKTVATGSTDYAYDREHRLIAEIRSGSVQHTVYLDGQPLARIGSNSTGSPIFYFLNDHLGMPRLVTGQNRQVVWNAQFDAFGQATVVNSSITQNIRFPGQYYDAETGWHYNFNRYYDPNIGRYLQSDPIGLDGGINTYTYVGNNPLRYIDPLGLCATSNPSQNCLNALLVANANSGALTRVNDNWATIQGAADANGINPNLLAAIGIRESGFQNIPQSGGGLGAGVFQIDLGQNPSVTQSQAYNILFSANFAANMLATNMSTLAAAHPNLNSSQLLQATAASYNFGTGNISGNPNTIDIGSTGNNYGSNVLNILFNCFNP